MTLLVQALFIFFGMDAQAHYGDDYQTLKRQMDLIKSSGSVTGHTNTADATLALNLYEKSKSKVEAIKKEIKILSDSLDHIQTTWIEKVKNELRELENQLVSDADRLEWLEAQSKRRPKIPKKNQVSDEFLSPSEETFGTDPSHRNSAELQQKRRNVKDLRAKIRIIRAELDQIEKGQKSPAIQQKLELSRSQILQTLSNYSQLSAQFERLQDRAYLLYQSAAGNTHLAEPLKGSGTTANPGAGAASGQSTMTQSETKPPQVNNTPEAVNSINP